MFMELATIFISVITPVIMLVAIGYAAGVWLKLDPRTLTRVSYYILIPAFIFQVISTAKIEAALAVRMILFALTVQLLLAGLGWAAAKILRRPPKMVSAYILIAIFANVGNFGLPLIEFRFGPDALSAAVVYFLVITIAAFIIGVAAAVVPSGGGLKAVLAVFKTPALIALVPALAANIFSFQPPLFADRFLGLLTDATVPTMLLALGVQLSSLKEFTFSSDVIIASAVRLLGGALLALALAIPFGLTGIERGAGILQLAMPAAVLSAIIAMEYDLIPEFVTTTVLFSTLASIFTIALIMVIL